MSLSNVAGMTAVDAAAYSTGTSSIGIGYPITQPSVVNTGYMPGAAWEPNTYGFKVVKVENGWTISIDNKQWICQTPQDIADRMVAILVQERLSK